MAQSTLPLDRRTSMAAELTRYSARRVTNNIVSAVLFVLTAISVMVLFVIIAFVFIHGISTIFPTVNGHITFNADYFTHSAAAPGAVKADGTPDAGGVLNGIVNTIELLIVASIIAVPVGLGTAIYLSEYSVGRLAEVVRFVINLLAGLPSVLVGLFIWALFIHGGALPYSGFAGALALAIIIIPIVASSVKSILQLVPGSLREAGLALGMPKWRVILQIVIPTVAGGVATGVLLALARAAGETAPLLLTIGGAPQFLSTDLGAPMTSLTLQIYNYATSAYQVQKEQAWANALVLITVIAMFSAAVRYITGRRRFDN